MTHLLLITALVLSTIAAVYAVAGLVAIFAASAVSIMIMGGALEASKLVVASWLYRNWKEIPFMLKSYFTFALVVLMLLTSMGIFGYLSKAHIDQAIPTGDLFSKLELIDDKIKIQRENINAARTTIEQLDQQINRFTELGAVTRGVNTRREQTEERSTLIGEIEKAQTEIQKLNQERQPIASDVRQVEVKVGPLKYIAALIYGDETNEAALEKAVRYVIIMIVLVFDPLAVLMLIAWNREQKKNAEFINDSDVTAFFERGKAVARALDEQVDLPEEVKQDVVYEKEPPTPTSEDWHQKLYARAVPHKTEDFLKTVEKIKEEPVVSNTEPPAPLSEEEFSLTTDIQETLHKPTNGRPERYK